MNLRKGFTLIELLVVIAIIAILSVVVVLTLNPAELLRQSRDSNRMSDLATLKNAISLYLVDVPVPNLASSTATCGTASSYGCIYYSQTNPPSMGVASSGFLAADFGSASSTGTSSRNVNSTGWIPINFSAITSGSPLGALPVDPVNSTTSLDAYGNPLIYGYAATTTRYTFKMTAHMESVKFRPGGSNDVESGNEGNSTTTFEQGSLPYL